MKSLILKDLYNIGHNAKSMLFILVVLAIAIIPASGAGEYIFTCGILCSMMIVTTFSFDDNSQWTRYAIIMPISKRDLVIGKFIVLAIFCAVGSVFGLLLASFLIPVAICFGVYKLLAMLGIEMTDQVVFILLCGSPVTALVWGYGMYQISYRIFLKQEL